jgi:hypothetical protein
MLRELPPPNFIPALRDHYSVDEEEPWTTLTSFSSQRSAQAPRLNPRSLAVSSIQSTYRCFHWHALCDRGAVHLHVPMYHLYWALRAMTLLVRALEGGDLVVDAFREAGRSCCNGQVGRSTATGITEFKECTLITLKLQAKLQRGDGKDFYAYL